MGEVLVRKEYKHKSEFIFMEVFFGLCVLAMFLAAFLLPLDEDVLFIRYIFVAIGALIAVPLILGVISHIKYVNLPDSLLVKTDSENFFDFFNRQAIAVKSVKEVKVSHFKNKYGKAYPYGDVFLITDYKTIKIRYAADIDEAKEKIESILKEKGVLNG